MGKSKSDKTPKATTETILDIHTIQPKAIPAVLAIPKIDSIPAMAAGYVPKPLFVKANVKLPTTKAIITVLIGMIDVSGNACNAA